MGFLHAVIYMIFLGILCFPFGRLLARSSFPAERFPFRPLPCEQNGKCYEKLGVRFWQKKAPDISRLIPGIVPRKEMAERPDAQKLRSMINETCVAELTHIFLSAAGLAILPIWKGIGGVMLYLAYLILGNLSFIMIQRYNRPRLVRLLKTAEKRERRVYEGPDSKQQ